MFLHDRGHTQNSFLHDETKHTRVFVFDLIMYETNCLRLVSSCMKPNTLFFVFGLIMCQNLFLFSLIFFCVSSLLVQRSKSGLAPTAAAGLIDMIDIAQGGAADGEWRTAGGGQRTVDGE